MTKPLITGDEPYYPVTFQPAPFSLETALMSTDIVFTGITIRQEFIADFIKDLWIKMYSSRDPTNCKAITDEAELAFETYLKLINKPQS